MLYCWLHCSEWLDKLMPKVIMQIHGTAKAHALPEVVECPAFACRQTNLTWVNQVRGPINNSRFQSQSFKPIRLTFCHMCAGKVDQIPFTQSFFSPPRAMTRRSLEIIKRRNIRISFACSKGAGTVDTNRACLVAFFMPDSVPPAIRDF